MSFVYLVLLVLTLALPLSRSFDKKINLRRKWRFIVPSVFYTAFVFIVWDVCFTHIGLRNFNPKYILGFSILGLPVEEWLFFFIIPYFCFYVYELLNYLFIPSSQYRKIVYFNYALAACLLVLSVFSFHKTYSFVALLMAAVVLFLVTSFKPIRSKLKRFYFAYFVCLLPFIMVNGVLTSLPVVGYNSASIVGYRVFSIAVEDLFYAFSILLVDFSIYELLRFRAHKS